MCRVCVMSSLLRTMAYPRSGVCPRVQLQFTPLPLLHILTGACPCCIPIPMLHPYTHAASPCPCYVPILHFHNHAASPCPCYIPIPMLYCCTLLYTHIPAALWLRENHSSLHTSSLAFAAWLSIFHIGIIRIIPSHLSSYAANISHHPCSNHTAPFSYSHLRSVGLAISSPVYTFTCTLTFRLRCFLPLNAHMDPICHSFRFQRVQYCARVIRRTTGNFTNPYRNSGGGYLRLCKHTPWTPCLQQLVALVPLQRRRVPKCPLTADVINPCNPSPILRPPCKIVVQRTSRFVGQGATSVTNTFGAERIWGP